MSINVTAPVNSLGYGYVSLNVLRGLEAIGEEPALWPIGRVEAPQEHATLIRKAIGRQERFCKDAPSLRIYHQFDLAHHVGRGPRVGFPIFELDWFKPNELVHLNSQDFLVVASDWAKEVLLDSDVDVPVFVAPLGVDTTIFRPVDPPIGGPTRFLNCGKWELRKGHDVLCEAFNLAFEKSDNVELVMHCHNPCFQDKAKYLSYNAEWESYYKESKLGDKIEISRGRFESQRDVASLMATVDCGVFPSRAEGWNMEAAEMLAMGKQLIITDYSAHTQFCHSLNSLLIPFSRKEAAHDGHWFNSDDPRWNGTPGGWMEFGESQMDALIGHLRTVHRQKQDGMPMLNEAGVATAKSLTWDITAQNIVSHFEEINAI